MNVGEVVTFVDTEAIGAEKKKDRPVVIVCDFGKTMLIAPITDANKKALPTHHYIGKYASGTSVKPALVTTEHARSVPPSLLQPRPGAAGLKADIPKIRFRLRLALGLESVLKPPNEPSFPRGSRVKADFGAQAAPLVTDLQEAIVLSNDQGNYFGQHFLVAPVLEADGLCPIRAQAGAQSIVLDFGQLRVVDASRMKAKLDGRLAPACMKVIDDCIAELIP